MRYRIAWSDQLGGRTHRGEPFTTDYEDAARVAKDANARYPELDHWVEEVTEAAAQEVSEE